MLGFASLEGLCVVNGVLRPLPGERVGICGARTVSTDMQFPGYMSGSDDNNVDVLECASATVNTSGSASANVLPNLPTLSPTVFEYSEIDLSRVAPDRQFCNILHHLFRADFLAPLLAFELATGKSATPPHLALKRVPYLDSVSGALVEPSTPNALKLEHFIFDYFHFCAPARFGCFEVPRTEFVPLKEPSDVALVLSAWAARIMQ